MVEAITQGLERGRSQTDIARELGLSPSTVSRHARLLGYRRRTRTTRFDWHEIRAFYEAGHTVRECQARFGFSNGAWDAAAARGDVTPRTDSHSRIPGGSRQAVAALLTEGLTLAAIARKLGLSRSAISHHARKLGIAPDERCNRRYDWAEIQRYHDAGYSARECKDRFGFSSKTWHDARERGVLLTRPAAAPLDAYVIRGRKVGRGHLKKRLIAAGLKENRCEICGIDAWLGQPLSLALHHVNGDGTDNRLGNLQLL